MPILTEANKRIVNNSLALCLRMFVTMGISIYSSRIVLENLGVIDYGIYNVVGGVIAMFAILNNSMVNSTQRFLNIEIGKGDIGQTNNVFSTSINIHFLIALAVLILGETIGLYILNYKLDIPADRLYAANIVLQFSILSSVLNIISIPYNALIIAYEKMGIFALIAIVQSVTTLVISISLKYCGFDRLVAYSIMLCLLQVGIRLFYGLYCRKHMKEIKYKRIQDRLIFKDMLFFSGWTMTGTFAYMTYTQGTSILLNMFFGPVVNAAQALSTQVSNSLSTFSSNFMVAVKPQITKSYAEGNLERMRKLVLFSSKFSFVIMLVVSLPFYVRTEYILDLWLKEVPQHTIPFLRLCLCIAVWQTLATPIVSAIHSTGNVKFFQIVESCALLSIFPMSYLILCLEVDAEYVYVTQLAIMVITQFLRTYFLKKQIGQAFGDYFKMVGNLCIVAVLCWFAASYVSTIIPMTFVGFLLLCAFSVLVTFIISLFLLLRRDERMMVLKLIKIKK